MIDKAKLLQWIEDKKDVYGPPYQEDEFEKVQYWKGMLNMLVKLKQEIDLGEFDAPSN